MRLSSIGRLPVLVLTASALVFATSPAAVRAGPAAAGYRVVDLGTLGGDSSYATAMNDRGAVVGRSQVADGTYHGVLWRNGAMTDLGRLSPIDINNRGQIVGTLDDADGAYLWTKGTLVALGTLDGSFTYPVAVSDRGQVVGMSSTADESTVPFLWSRGRMRQLPLNTVSDINNRGQVAGGLLPAAGGYHACVWRAGRITDLGAGAFDRSNTYRINDKGWVIGWIFSPEQYERGALWRNGTMTDVGTLGGNLTHLTAINDRGEILAMSQVPDGNVHPALWWRGVLTDLTAAGIGADTDLADLNNRGDIAASIRTEWGIAHAVVYRWSTDGRRTGADTSS
jgi:probable HAF family extracellular repeat protein